MLAFLSSLIGPAAMVVAAIIIRSLKTPTDKDRADLLATIANASAALVVSKYPGASWAVLLQEVVREISKAAGLPTQNADAITRAAARALVDSGIQPVK